ncbi:SRPBCC domain-containing protein [Mucilaginibacter ximonensis]|uniref:SRPBCC domain-containing protein n=1 Tax=Mucilaginibacter ximonensis TaxID=538021 RepID=A0ABW5YB69_9SPHI
MPDIRHQLSISGEIHEVYTALTTAMGIRRWCTKNADLDQQVGGQGIFRFDYQGKVETIMRILNLQEPVLVTWAVESSFRPEQVGTLISFELCPGKKGIVLSFSQTGYREAGETFELMHKGWAYYLVSLKRYIETGQGAPSPDLNWNIMKENTTEFSCTISVPQPASEVFKAISQVSQWWVADVDGSADQPGAVFTVHFGTTWVKFQITGWTPGQQVTWQVIDCTLPWNRTDEQEWNGTAILWLLENDGALTRVTFTHEGLSVLDCAGQCEKAWTGYIQQSLFNYVSTGKGLPNRF